MILLLVFISSLKH